MAHSSKQESDGYSDMPLNTRQQNAVQVIKMWYPIQQTHIKCIETCITVISNVLYHPTQTKFHKLRLSKPKIKKAIVDIKGGVKLLKLGGFSQKTDTENGEKILYVEPPSTIEEFEQFTDIWLILLRTKFNCGINPDKNAPKGSILPTQFQIPNSLKYKTQTFFQTNAIAKSNEFQAFVQKSNDGNLSPNAEQRYKYFAKAIKMVSNKEFFDINAENGLNDIDTSDVCALIISEILCGYYNQDLAYTNLILAEDLRIIAEQQKDFAKEQYQIGSAMMSESESEPMETKYKKEEKILFEMKDEELSGVIRWIGESEKWDKGLWFGVEFDSENVVYGHNGYFNQERFFGCADSFGIYIRETQILKVITAESESEMKAEKSEKYCVIDIGCGWGNLGRLLMDKSARAYLSEIEKESECKSVALHGFDICAQMIEIAKENGFEKYYTDMTVLDCKRNELKQFKDGSVDVVCSVNCVMIDKKIGHPSETFLIEANRLLKVGGWFVVTRRFHGIHLGLQLYAYLMIAQQLGWKNVFASRVREVFYIGWQKMENPTV